MKNARRQIMEMEMGTVGTNECMQLCGMPECLHSTCVLRILACRDCPRVKIMRKRNMRTPCIVDPFTMTERRRRGSMMTTAELSLKDLCSCSLSHPSPYHYFGHMTKKINNISEHRHQRPCRTSQPFSLP